MKIQHRKFDVWNIVSITFLLLFIVFLVYPLFEILRQSVRDGNGNFTLSQFGKFFSQSYYSKTILNSFKVTIAITLVTLLLGVPISYFYSFYNLKGAKFLFVVSILCCMSAPFIGAYSWILLLGRSGVITVFLRNYLHIEIGSIYGFGGILLVQSLKLFLWYLFT